MEAKFWIYFCWAIYSTTFISGQAPPSPTNCPRPPNFPADITLQQQNFQNPDHTIRVKNLWTAIPKFTTDIVTLANWASANSYGLRPRGKMRNWSPLTVTESGTCGKILMVDTAEYLFKTDIYPNGLGKYPFPYVWAETGVTLDKLLASLEGSGLGIAVATALGDVTLGGALATAGHGFGIRINDSNNPVLHSYGSMSNLVLSIEAVAWDEATGQYTIQQFLRSTPECSALLSHVGLAFITGVTLRVEYNYNIRCVSRTDIPTSELFADPELGNSSVRTVGSLVEKTGLVNILWFPFTKFAWVKNCNHAQTKPELSRQVTTPYNYPFTSNIPQAIAPVLSSIISKAGIITPILCELQFGYVSSALTLTNSRDLWGPSQNHLFYVGTNTILVSVMGYAILTSRSNIQKVVFMVVSRFNLLLEEFRKLGKYPVNEAMEIRITGVDDPMDLDYNGSLPGFINPASVMDSNPEFNSVVWFDITTVPDTPDSFAFLQAMESFYLSNFNGSVGYARPEWSKGWAYTGAGRWNSRVAEQIVPSRYKHWNRAVCYFNKLDRKGIYGNDFLKKLFNSTQVNLNC